MAYTLRMCDKPNPNESSIARRMADAQCRAGKNRDAFLMMAADVVRQLTIRAATDSPLLTDREVAEMSKVADGLERLA